MILFVGVMKKNELRANLAIGRFLNDRTERPPEQLVLMACETADNAAYA